MNQTKQQELLDFWEYKQGLDTEDGTVPIDEYISNDAIQQEMQNELNYINELELEQELHPIADDDFHPEDEHPDRTLLKRDIHAIALKRMEDASPLDIIIPAPTNHTYWRQIMKGDFIDVIFNCPIRCRLAKPKRPQHQRCAFYDSWSYSKESTSYTC